MCFILLITLGELYWTFTTMCETWNMYLIFFVLLNNDKVFYHLTIWNWLSESYWCDRTNPRTVALKACVLLKRCVIIRNCYSNYDYGIVMCASLYFHFKLHEFFFQIFRNSYLCWMKVDLRKSKVHRLNKAWAMSWQLLKPRDRCTRIHLLIFCNINLQTKV